MQGRMGNFYWRGLASSYSRGGKEEEFETSIFPFWKVKAIPNNCKDV